MPRWHDGYQHRIVIKFADGQKARLGEGKFDLPSSSDANELASILASHDLTMKSVVSLTDKKVDEFENRARDLSSAEPADLRGIFAAAPSDDQAATISAALELSTLASVDYVYLEPLAVPPPGDIAPMTELYTDRQTYGGPSGIDAAYAHSIGIRGAGIRLADVEYGWYYEHEDLIDRDLHPEPGQTMHPDVIAREYPHHGTAVIGVTSAVDNEYGMTGLVPDAEVYTYPEWTMEEGMRSAGAVAAALAGSRPGDVVLLEMQTIGPGDDYIPAEYDPTIWQMVKTATDAGVVVVAAAGNGEQNLDDPLYADYLARGDSGAIIVGAGSANGEVLDFSTYGSRVDLQGQGQVVATLGYGNLIKLGGDLNQYYARLFMGTSSASPIVASACVAIQSFALEYLGHPLQPRELRDLLKSTGTPQPDPQNGPIGPRPNIRAAIEKLIADNSIEVCSDGQDNNGDQVVDCAETSCATNRACMATGSQIYEATPQLAIPDANPEGVTSVIHVDDAGSLAGSVNVTLDITHPYSADLIVTLSKDGVTQDVARRVGGSSSNLQGTFMLSGFSGTRAGDWVLKVVDEGTGDVGTLNRWSLEIVQ